MLGNAGTGGGDMCADWSAWMLRFVSFCRNICEVESRAVFFYPPWHGLFVIVRFEHMTGERKGQGVQGLQS